jgi:hypothetical protein
VAAAIVLTPFGPVSDAQAITLGTPANGATTTSTPTFTWGLGTGEDASAIEITPNPALGSGGGFANDEELRFAGLAAAQTSYTVGTSEPLFAGTWYWHVSVFDDVPCCDYRWSEIRSVQVPDEPIRLLDLDVDYLDCIRKLQLQFEYSDNSADQFASWQLVFSKKKSRGTVARRYGESDESEFGSVYESFKRPHDVRVGRRYFVRLVLQDRALHVTESSPVRLRITSC